MRYTFIRLGLKINLILSILISLNCTQQSKSPNDETKAKINLFIIQTIQQNEKARDKCNYRGLPNTDFWGNTNYYAYRKSPYLGTISAGSTLICDSGTGSGFATFDYPSAGTYKITMQTNESIDYKPRSAILGIDIELYTAKTSPDLSAIRYEVSRLSNADSKIIKQICITNARFLECTDIVTASSLRRSAWFELVNNSYYTCVGTGCAAATSGNAYSTHAVTISKID